MLLLLPRFCAYFSLQTFKTMINVWPHLKPPSPKKIVKTADGVVLLWLAVLACIFSITKSLN